MTSHNFQRLKDHILPISVASDFERARLEWRLERIEISEDIDHCPCGKEIREHCYLKNIQNGNETYVGNVCVNQFIGLDTATLFDGLKRIRNDQYANANEVLIRYARDRGYLYDGEEKFLMSTKRKRNLSQKQLEWKRKINRRILEQIVVKRRGGA